MSRIGPNCLRLGTATLVMLAFTLLPSGHAQAAVYTYQGNNFTGFVGSGPYTTAMNVSGSFELALPLPPNVPLSSVPQASLVSFSFFDGVETRTDADSVACRFEVATDLNGRIVQWHVFLRETGINAGDPQHALATVREVFYARDVGEHVLATADDCDTSTASVVVDNADVNDTPGIWTSDVAPVPTLTTWFAILLSGLLALLGIAALRGYGPAPTPWTLG